MKINKATDTDTASLLYQTNWSGRAEMGLAGNDDFSVKVSADGSNFTEALRINGSTGVVNMPQTATRQLTPYMYRYSFYPDRRWVAPWYDTSVSTATLNLGTGAEPAVKWSTNGLLVTAQSILHGFKVTGHGHDDILDLDLRLCFQTGPWNNSWNSISETALTILYAQDDVGLSEGSALQSLYIPLNFTVPTDGRLYLAARPNSTSTLSTTSFFHMSGLLDAANMPLTA